MLDTILERVSSHKKLLYVVRRPMLKCNN